jgi:anti-anti-sigma regulatory factor
MVLQLVGEVDLESMSRFGRALDVLISLKPQQIVFDLRRTDFISVAGYAAIGRCSLVVDQLSVCTKSGLAQKILRLLGYDSVVCVTAELSESLPSPETLRSRQLAVRKAYGAPFWACSPERRGDAATQHRESTARGAAAPHFVVAGNA